LSTEFIEAHDDEDDDAESSRSPDVEDTDASSTGRFGDTGTWLGTTTAALKDSSLPLRARDETSTMGGACII